MPNHVTHLCSVSGDESDVRQFESAHLIGGELDFNTVIPCPQSVRDTKSSTTSELWYYALTGTFPPKGRYTTRSLLSFGMVPREITSQADLMVWLNEKFPNDRAEGEASVRAVQETGFCDWYEWNCHNWGTKWNAYDQEVRIREPGTILHKFETAWSFPLPVFKKLAELFPGLVFDLRSFDEGWNFGCSGQFNGRNDFQTVKATAELYELVYGEKYESEQDDDSMEPQKTFSLVGGRSHKTLYGARMAALSGCSRSQVKRLLTARQEPVSK